MQCPYCDFQDARVIDSRLSEGKDAVRRRRECVSCGKRFTTYERREPLRLMVIKRDGTREPFDRTKLRDGLAKACAKRPIPEEEIEYMVDEIEAALDKRPRRREVSSRRLGDMALVQLRRLDMVSYLRFASVYRQYTNAEQFRSELVRLAGAATYGSLRQRV
jgi:transcriptional repressor NrdR